VPAEADVGVVEPDADPEPDFEPHPASIAALANNTTRVSLIDLDTEVSV